MNEAPEHAIHQVDLWKSGTHGYHTYRIPALAVTTSGTLLAFCEGRKETRSDAGKIDMLVRRSTDHGITWSSPQVVWEDELNTCGNPAPVVDRETGTIWLLMTWNRGEDREVQIRSLESQDTRRVFVTSSTDDGQTWSSPQEITASVKQPDWTWYATGPSSGFQIEHGDFSGRLVIACDHIVADPEQCFSHIIFSDDHGSSWQLGGIAPQAQVNESAAVELSDGQLMLNMRNWNSSREYDLAHRHRQIALSSDGGNTWVGQRFDDTLIEPICQGSLCHYSHQESNRHVILFANPADTHEKVNVTVRASFDDGLTWPAKTCLHQGPGAYSDLAVCNNGQIACLYERGAENPYESITLALFDLSQIETTQEL